MRALVQRVSEASVKVKGEIIGTISCGLCIFVGVTQSDSKAVAEKLAKKIFDEQEKQSKKVATTSTKQKQSGLWQEKNNRLFL